MNHSVKFISWLISLEGCVPYVYDDKTGKPAINNVYKGYPTFGVGHLISNKDSPLFRFTKSSPATLDYCKTLLASDIIEYENCVKKAIKVPLKDYQFDALVSLCYNVGTSDNPKNPGFPLSQVCALVNKGVTTGTALQNAFNSWIKTKGVVSLTLVDRRKIEYKLFTTGVHTTYNSQPLQDVKK